MANLKLRGILSRIDSYDRLIVAFDDDNKPHDKTREKLNNVCRAEYKPFDNQEYKIKINPSQKKYLADFHKLVGLRVVVEVKVTSYSLVSQQERNKGEKISGTNLTLKDIEQEVS